MTALSNTSFHVHLTDASAVIRADGNQLDVLEERKEPVRWGLWSQEENGKCDRRRSEGLQATRGLLGFYSVVTRHAASSKYKGSGLGSVGYAEKSHTWATLLQSLTSHGTVSG